ncbi:ISXO2-like transposase domain protein [mine drainage metagenome]|uniref:ISXO2-like transposase domain protein n=1 Tax=mine drainage metagenome TaxID=410659 RepID=A0A1J5QRY7_9ZZZZ
MARSVLSAPQFQNEAEAFAYVEARLWPNGPVCPHCGETERVGRLNGKTTRAGLCKCYACKKPFTVRMGTIFESSHLPLHLWLQVIHLFCASKKGISTRQIQRMLNCSMKTAWFLGHRIREAMASSDLSPLGGSGVSVEVDETYISKSPKTRRKPHERTNTQILSLVERGGKLRSVFLDHKTIRNALNEHLDKESRLITDGHKAYVKYMPLGQHETVDHSRGEYVRGDVHVNTLEGFFSVFKRGLVGVYQHMDKKHLQRYLAEFDFRQNTREKLGITDTMRADIALQGVVGKRLTYQTTGV